MCSGQHNQLTLIGHKLCPYVQRTVIALKELGIAFKRIDIDLNNKPAWVKKLSPLGKVPVLVVDDETVLFESSVINEYVNEIGGGKMLSDTPVKKAKERAWVEFASSTLANVSQLYNAKDECSFTDAVNELQDKWVHLEENLAQSGFFNGEDFSLVDAAFAPVFRYFDVFERFGDFDFTNRFAKIEQWRKALGQRSSVINAVGPEYQEMLTNFVAAKESYLGELASTYITALVT
ncbi:MAG: glutathione S-transferase family protein [Algicola sp.]|nr:glutathione S-transferase family protein [Algicola sp.]